jgi:hypothetical protein
MSILRALLFRPLLAVAQFTFDVAAGLSLPVFYLIGIVLNWQKMLTVGRETYPDATTSDAVLAGFHVIVGPIRTHLFHAPLRAVDVLMVGRGALKLTVIDDTQ